MSYCDGINCVCRKVREIAAAQDQVNGNNNGVCDTSCDRSIADLLSPAANNNMNGNTTIPFALYCKGDCGPFLGSGVYQGTTGANGATYFGCVESPIFRVVGFEDEDGCCAQLELLLPATADGTTPGATGDGDSAICPFFPGQTITDFQATGVCITVDLNNFHSIMCLDPIRPLSAANFPATPTVPASQKQK